MLHEAYPFWGARGQRLDTSIKPDADAIETHYEFAMETDADAAMEGNHEAALIQYGTIHCKSQCGRDRDPAPGL